MASQQLPEQQPPSPQLPAVPLAQEPGLMKLTRGHSCVLCQARKVKCDRQKPCANCLKANVECKVIPPLPPRRRKKKPHERDLIERLKKYESLLAQHGVNFEPIAQDLKPSVDQNDINELGDDLIGLKTSPPGPNDQATDKNWFPYYNNNREYRNQDPHADSSDSETEGPTINNAFDTMFDDSDGFPFIVGGAVTSVTDVHPSAIQIFQLWQTYISNVNPLLKISHAPTLQAQIINGSANVKKITKPFEALMFAIYFIAITSMPEEEVQSKFGDDKTILLNKYHGATQQALINAGFMRSTDIHVLQAYFLYLLCVRQYVDPRALFCLVGIAVRIATRLGLHKDSHQFGLTPFETEQRRRLWWQIVVFDKRIAEITGSTITALSSSDGDSRLPLNVNDTDLNVHAKDPPIPYSGPTEMMFALTRIELTVAAPPGGAKPQPAMQTNTSTPGSNSGKASASAKTRVAFSPSPSSPDVVGHVAHHYMPENLNAFCAHIEETYLKHCDPKIPLHLLTIAMTRQQLGKLRVIDFIGHGISTDSLSDTDRDSLFIEAVQVLEYDNVIQRTEELQGFRWYSHLQVPLPAYIFLLSELRTRTTGDLCERAWGAFMENHELRGFQKNFRSPMYVSVGAFFVKAWEAREVAEAQRGRQLPTPRLIQGMRTMQAKLRAEGQIPGPQANQRGPPGAMGGGGKPGMGGMGMGMGPGMGMGMGHIPGASAQVASSSSNPSSIAASSSPATNNTPTPAPIPTSVGESPMYHGGNKAGGSGLHPDGTPPHHPSQQQQMRGPGLGPGMPGQHQQPPPAQPGGMMLDDSTALFPPFVDSVNQMFGPSLQQDLDFGQVDWNYLVQYGGGGGFSGYVPGGGGSGGMYPGGHGGGGHH